MCVVVCVYVCVYLQQHSFITVAMGGNLRLEIIMASVICMREKERRVKERERELRGKTQREVEGKKTREEVK